MKPTIIISMAVLGFTALSGLAFLAVDSMPERPQFRASYILDMTDSFRISESMVRPEHAFSWNEIDQGRIVRMRRITDVIGEEVSIMELPTFRDLSRPETWHIDQNNFVREREVTAFDRQVDATLEEISNEPRGRDHSAVLEPLVEELAYLEHYPGDDRYVFLFSDLGQNSYSDNWVSSSDTIAMLAHDDPQPWEHIRGTAELKDLTGITVYIIHQSESSKRDAFFSIRAQYVKRRLVDLGATVVIQGSTQHIPLSHG